MLGRVWELLYIEGSAPDVGKRRENFIKLLLRYEFGLQVESAPDTERSWDFKVKIGNKRYTYSLKTTERPTTVKVAWNGFPSWERAESFSFKYPILYVTGDRSAKKIDIYVFTPELISKVRSEMGRAFWWMPRGDTNPRGFGISSEAVRRLMSEAEREGNHVGKKYEPVSDLKRAVEGYWEAWYHLLKKLAGFNG
ncbi:ThaI family type II restriction endonuclease [Desulfurococcus sp.]|uniref:ThaI family type II restriction endonuclease n=1 Tax=Desulfurococcus sp. TaxID=51678 RepID=UPI00319E3A95